MTLEEFAKNAGVRIVECPSGWGGHLGYTEADHPNMKCCGFRTKKSAYRHWLKTTFGKKTALALIKLLAESERYKERK